MVSRISTLVMGGRILDVDRPYGQYSVERLVELAQWGPRLQVVTGVLEQRCRDLRAAWLARQARP